MGVCACICVCLCELCMLCIYVHCGVCTCMHCGVCLCPCVYGYMCVLVWIVYVVHVRAWWGCVCMRAGICVVVCCVCCVCCACVCMVVCVCVCAHLCKLVSVCSMLNIPNTSKFMTGSSLLHRAPVATITHRCTPVHHIEKTCCWLCNGLRAKHPLLHPLNFNIHLMFTG